MYQRLSCLSVCFILAAPLLVGCAMPIAPLLPPQEPTAQRTTWRYSQFMQAVQNGQVTHVAISADRTFAIATMRQQQSFCVNLTQNPTLIATLVKNNVAIAVLPERMGSKLENNSCR
jgi:ATP-dependent Zn protease